MSLDTGRELVRIPGFGMLRISLLIVALYAVSLCPLCRIIRDFTQLLCCESSILQVLFQVPGYGSPFLRFSVAGVLLEVVFAKKRCCRRRTVGPRKHG